MKRILGVLLAGVLLLSGCGQWQKSQKESAYHLYCLDKTGTTLVQEPYEPKEGTDQKLIKELVDALQEKPAGRKPGTSFQWDFHQDVYAGERAPYAELKWRVRRACAAAGGFGTCRTGAYLCAGSGGGARDASD